jgi:hypothetical protein
MGHTVAVVEENAIRHQLTPRRGVQDASCLPDCTRRVGAAVAVGTHIQDQLEEDLGGIHCNPAAAPACKVVSFDPTQRVGERRPG